MQEFITKITSLSSKEIWADIHGGLSMLALIFFGSSLTLFFLIPKSKTALAWLRKTLAGLVVSLAALDLLGLFIYIPYRAAGGPRTKLLASEETAWLHKILFEHKEFLAFAPVILAAVAFVIVKTQGENLLQKPYLKKAVLFSLVAALIFVLVVASEAVLITKVQPLR